jgi:hypothetical protein
MAIVFPTRSPARLNRFPFAETSAVVGALGAYSAPAATRRTGAPRDFKVARPLTLKLENAAVPESPPPTTR